MIQFPHSTELPSEPRRVFIAHKGGDRLRRGLEELLVQRGFEALLGTPERRQKAKPPPLLPDGLRTPAEAARKLHCSVKTFNGYVKSGALKYVAVGHGTKRPRKMFTDPDLNEFIAAQTRKDIPCPSTAAPARRSGSTIFGGEVIAYTALRNARPGGKPKK